MYDTYFDEVINRLTFEDYNFLGCLYGDGSINPFTAINKTKIKESTDLTESVFRKVETRLYAMLLIDQVIGSKNNSYYLTNYGLSVLQKHDKGDVE